MIRPSWDQYFLGLAQQASVRSTCHRLHVGAVLVDSRHWIRAVGYNGAPAGRTHCDPDFCYEGGPPCLNTVHAEENALEHRGQGRGDLTLYVTHAPCVRCLQLGHEAGVNRVVYTHSYRGLDETMVLASRLGVDLSRGDPAPCASAIAI